MTKLRVNSFRIKAPEINEVFVSVAQGPEEMDRLWSLGWRHFGPLFFRSSYTTQNGPLQEVQPLRVRLDRFQPSHSQRRARRKNADLQVLAGPPALDDPERHFLFERHKRRFKQNVPESLYDFLGAGMAIYPCECLEVAVMAGDRLVAASYLDLGQEGASSVYGMFEPDEKSRSLGIFTMLCEVDVARQRGCQFYYPGYAYHEPSSMDYKKQFAGLEWFDWQGEWKERMGDQDQG